MNDLLDAERYRWLRANLNRINTKLWPKNRMIPCPDNIPGCMVAHFAPITIEDIDASIDEAMKKDPL